MWLALDQRTTALAPLRRLTGPGPRGWAPPLSPARGCHASAAPGRRLPPRGKAASSSSSARAARAPAGLFRSAIPDSVTSPLASPRSYQCPSPLFPESRHRYYLTTNSEPKQLFTSHLSLVSALLAGQVPCTGLRSPKLCLLSLLAGAVHRTADLVSAGAGSCLGRRVP